MQPSLIEYLEQIGLSEKEIKVYTYLLSVDMAYPIDIAQETSIKRSTVYVIIEFLKEKGMVREIIHGKRGAYQAEAPERIKFLLEERKLKTEEYIKSFEKILPQIKATGRKHGQVPIIKLYEGERAVQESMTELVMHPKFKTDTDYAVFPLELVNKLFRHKNLRQFIDSKIKNNERFKCIYTAEEGKLEINDDMEQEAVLVDGKQYPLSCDISIFEDEVRFHMLGDNLYGIMIKNPELAQTLTSLIKLAMKNVSATTNS